MYCLYIAERTNSAGCYKNYRFLYRYFVFLMTTMNCSRINITIGIIFEKNSIFFHKSSELLTIYCILYIITHTTIHNSSL